LTLQTEGDLAWSQGKDRQIIVVLTRLFYVSPISVLPQLRSFCSFDVLLLTKQRIVTNSLLLQGLKVLQ